MAARGFIPELRGDGVEHMPESRNWPLSSGAYTSAMAAALPRGGATLTTSGQAVKASPLTAAKPKRRSNWSSSRTGKSAARSRPQREVPSSDEGSKTVPERSTRT